LSHPVSRNAAIRVFRMIAIACSAGPARRVDASSLKVVSRTQWVLFSMAPQCSRSSWGEVWGSGLVRGKG
jgi:hypothetical protein